MSDEARLEPVDDDVGYRLTVRLGAEGAERLEALMERESLSPSEAVARALAAHEKSWRQEQSRVARRRVVLLRQMSRAAEAGVEPHVESRRAS